MNQTILEVKGVSKTYAGKAILKDIGFTVNKGDVYGLLGPNGVGKTTTLKSIVGMIKPDQGQISVLNKSIQDGNVISSKVGVSIENPCFYEHLSGYKNLIYYAGLVNQNRDKVEEVLEVFDLTKAKHVKVKEYSQGMKQRLAIARVFLNDPELIILDEPTNGLDPNGIRAMRALIIRLSKEFNKTILLSTHLLGEAMHICNRFGIICDGRIAVEDHMDAVVAKVGNEATAFEDYFVAFTEGGAHD